MTPEQQRELWLKRMLPALGILVIYFVIISGFVTEKSKKAEDQYVGLQQKGINAAALPGIEQQQRTITEEIAKLEQEDKAIHAAFAENSGFLSQSGSSNDAIEHISIILAKHHLQVLNEQHNDKPVVASLPRSLRDTLIWLKDMVPAESATHGGAAVTGDDKNLNIWTIRYIGDYPDNYRALSALNDSHIKALPVSLTMQTYKAEPGKQEWLLTLWL